MMIGLCRCLVGFQALGNFGVCTSKNVVVFIQSVLFICAAISNHRVLQQPHAQVEHGGQPGECKTGP